MNNLHPFKFLPLGTSLLFIFLLSASLPSQERTVVDFDSPIRWIIPNEGSNLEDEWKDTGFDDSEWNEGTFAIGYNAGGMIRTEVPEGTTVIFVRRTFELDTLADIDSVSFAVDFDDGYAAWLNGNLISLANVDSENPSWDHLASSNHESSNDAVPDFDDAEDITPHALPLLQVGENVLAIAVYNDAEDSSDLAIAANLTFNPPKPIEGTELCGEYEEVVTLTQKDSPYTASCDVTFHPSSVLNIEAGVQIFSSEGVDIVIEGEVNMLGGEEHPILFKGNLSEWHGVTIDYSDLEGTVRSVIRHVTFDGGEDLLKVESTGESNVLVENCKFDNWSHLALDWDDCPQLTIRGCEFGLNTPEGERDQETIKGKNGGAVVEHCTFGRREGYNDVFDLSDTSWEDTVPVVRYNTFLGGEDDAIDLDSCDGFVIGNLIMNFHPVEGGSSRANGGGLTGQDSAVVGIGNVIVNCYHGVGYKNDAQPLLIGNLVYGCNVGYTFYQDECDEPNPHAVMINNIAWNNYDWETGENQNVVLNGAWWGDYCDTVDPPQATADVSYSLIEGGWEGEGNIDADPLFVDPENLNFTLGLGSPALDAAFSGEVEYEHVSIEDLANLIETDIEGRVRIDLDCADNEGSGPISFMDIGPFESQTCESIIPRFLRGDSNGDGSINLGDPIGILVSLFIGGDPHDCEDAQDVDDDGVLNLTDPIALLNYLFLGGAAPLPPFPGKGTDPTEDNLAPCFRS